MASINCSLLCPFMIVFINLPPCKTTTASSFPLSQKGIFLETTKNSSTLLHTTQIHQQTYHKHINLLVDIGYRSVYIECSSAFGDSMFNVSRCGSQQCEFAKVDFCSEECDPHAFRQYCVKDSCFSIYHYDDNLIGNTLLFGFIAEADISFQSIDHNSSTTQTVEFPRFILTCADLGYYNGNGIVDGVAAMGRSQDALPSQLATAFNFSRKFSLCLSSSPKSKGWINFVDAKYPLSPKANVTKFLKYTPLITSLYGVGSDYRAGVPSSAYFLGVTSIKVGGKTVKGFNHELLSINETGIGGTTITSSKQYTMETTRVKLIDRAK